MGKCWSLLTRFWSKLIFIIKQLFIGKLYLGDLEVTNYDTVMALSGVTTAHTANTDIHVTANDKLTWNSHTANTEIHVTQALLDRIAALEKEVWCNKHDYVEIGGIKWATKNVGACDITDTGLYFQWGDTQGYTADQVGSGSGQKYFGWADYKYGNGTSSPGDTGMTKYNSTDGKTVLDISDDAARANWGGFWRIPTKEEFITLGNAVNTAWTSDYKSTSIAGMICTAKNDSGAELFFPAAGFCSNGGMANVGFMGLFCNNSRADGLIQYAYGLNFSIDASPNWRGNRIRCYGYPVRGVLDV